MVMWWHQNSKPILVQVMARCLTAPSHYLNQCWLIIAEVQWHSPDGNFTRDASVVNQMGVTVINLRFHSYLPWACEFSITLLIQHSWFDIKLIKILDLLLIPMSSHHFRGMGQRLQWTAEDVDHSIPPTGSCLILCHIFHCQQPRFQVRRTSSVRYEAGGGWFYHTLSTHLRVITWCGSDWCPAAVGWGQWNGNTIPCSLLGSRSGTNCHTHDQGGSPRGELISFIHIGVHSCKNQRDTASWIAGKNKAYHLSIPIKLACWASAEAFLGYQS